MTVSRSIPNPEQQFQAVQVSFGVRFMLRDGTEFEGQVTQMSPGSAHVETDAQPSLGERIVAYVDHIGRIEGQAWRVLEDGFGITVEATSPWWRLLRRGF